MDYTEWVERVLHAAAAAIAASPGDRLIGVPIAEVARALDVGIDPQSPEFHQSDERAAIIHSSEDLGTHARGAGGAALTFAHAAHARVRCAGRPERNGVAVTLITLGSAGLA
jgi:hypothetical protein